MSSAFETITRNGLIQELENFFDKGECRNGTTSINMKFGDISRDDIKTNVGSPQSDGTFFNIALEKSLKSFREEMNKENLISLQKINTFERINIR